MRPVLFIFVFAVGAVLCDRPKIYVNLRGAHKGETPMFSDVGAAFGRPHIGTIRQTTKRIPVEYMKICFCLPSVAIMEHTVGSDALVAPRTASVSNGATRASLPTRQVKKI